MDAPDPERLTAAVTSPARPAAWAARRRAAATLLAVVSVLATALGTVAPTAVAQPLPPGPAAAPAHARQDDGLHLELDDVEPTVARVDEPVTLTGRIVNDGPQRRRLSDVQALAAWTPLGSRAEVSAWLRGEDPGEAGWILGRATVGPVVAAGREIPFRVEVPAGTFAGLPADLTALAVELRASGDDGSGPVVLRTTLTVSRGEEVAAPLEHAWVVPLTLPPDPDLASTEETARQEAWHAAVGPGSPARTWLDVLDGTEATWLVDPSLLVQLSPEAGLSAPAPGEETPVEETPAEPPDDDATQTPPATTTATATAPTEDAPTEDAAAGTDGAAVTAPPPTRSPGDQGLDVGGGLGTVEDDDGRPVVVTREVVEEELDALRDRLGEVAPERLWWLPTADPDVAALLELGASPPTLRSVMGLPLADHAPQVDELLERGRHDVAWPALAAPSADDVTRLDRLWAGRSTSPGGLSVLVLPQESLSGASSSPVGRAAARRAGEDSVTALGVDSRASGLLAQVGGTAADRGVGTAVQELLADSLTAYLQRPGESRSLVYAPPRGTDVPPEVLAEVTEGLGEAPWTTEVAADELVAAAAGADPLPLTGAAPDAEVLGTLAEGVVPSEPALDEDRLRALLRLSTRVHGLAQVLTDPSAVESWRAALAQQWATRWRAARDRWPRTYHHVGDLASATAAGVHVNPSTVNFLSDSGIMQVTVVNDLPVDVEGVRVRVVPDKSLLRIVEQPEPVSVGAESRATVSFTAQAVARGRTTVTAQLTTPNGTRLGDDAIVTVRVRPTGVWIYWVLGSAAGLVLVLGLVRALRAQPRAASVAGAGPDETSGEGGR